MSALSPRKMNFQAHSKWTNEDGHSLEIEKMQINYQYAISGNEVKSEPCPVELFIGAIGSCFITTFLNLASKRDILTTKLDLKTAITLQLQKGKYEVESLKIYGIINTSSNSHQIAQQLIDLALESCPLINLVRGNVSLSTEVEIA